MAKLYIFGIGGTGSRVMRAFTYLLASGVKPYGFSEIVPIIIDADNTAGDKTDTVRLMQNYMKLYKGVDHTSAAFNDGFFPTKIASCCNNTYFTLQIPGATTQRFKNYMQFQSLDEENKAMVQMLFSEENLESDMSVGFKGNPNIGSIVLNQFIESEDFRSFADNFAQGDAIFIISSIFGGTGASGFPLLLKNLRSNNTQSITNANIISQAQIGAISVLPYFNLESVEEGKDGQLDGSTFIQKTRAALRYYANNLGDLDHLYYIADDLRPTYENCDGGSHQQNKPNFIEFVSALSIFHFAQVSANADLSDEHITKYHEYGIKEDLQEFNFSNLYDQTLNLVRKPMTKFLLMHNFMSQSLSDSWKQSWAAAHEPIFNITNINEGGFFDTLSEFMKGYHWWLEGMATNVRSFAPFNLNTDGTNVFELVSGIKAERHFMGDKNYDRFNKTLCEIKNPKKKKMAEALKARSANWMDLFARATDQLVTEELHI